MAKIAWVGLGRMGLPMSTHLVNAGHQVKGYDIDVDAKNVAHSLGVEVCETIKLAVEEADYVFTMLPDGNTVLNVYSQPGGILDSASKEALLVDCSTVSISSCHEIYAETTARSLAFVDAPVSGGTVGAEAGTLSFMIGGSKELFDRAIVPIEVMSSNIFHTGDL
jgi:3-hydroxyisobutyrate dehydrogenase